MNIVFLDYDGVVNTLMFDGIKKDPYFNFPEDGKVNNYQAIMWLNKLCKDCDAKIVVTSTWREYDNYKECLYNGGLDKDIQILGKTEECYIPRGEEIKMWLEKHPDVENYVVLEDAEDVSAVQDHVVKTNTFIGFNYYSFNKAYNILMGLTK